MKSIALALGLIFWMGAPAASAQQTTTSADSLERAQVVSVVSESIGNIPGTSATSTYQTLSALITDGPDAGKTVMVNNDYFNLSVGDQFYALRSLDPSGAATYTLQEPYRLPILAYLAALFLVVVIVFGGRQGVRGLLSLAGSLAVIFYILLPAILAGYSPLLVSVVVSSIIIIIGSYITHGVNRTTSAAVLGMMVTIAVTGALAYWSVHAALLAGYSSEEVSALNFSTTTSIDFVGLLLGGIMIGLLGILYDAAIGQAVAVEELRRAAAHYSSWQLYRRAIRIGREHIGALVNTLAIAYVGVSLPLLLLLHFTSTSLATTVNQELFATEIIRTLVGSIGLILAVPITTLISIWLLHTRSPSAAEATKGHTHSA